MSQQKYSVDYVVGPTKGSVYGIKRYQDEIHSRLKSVHLKRYEYAVSQNRLISVLQRVLFSLNVFIRARGKNLKHFTTQYMAYLALLPGMENSVVTVYDTIFLERQKELPFLSRIFLAPCIAGIKKARKVITISNFSAKQIHRLIGVSEDKIVVIRPGIDLGFFRPEKPNPTRFELSGSPIILYLGSEDPRQNVDNILRAIAALKERYPSIIFAKAGKPQYKGGRERLVSLVEKFGLQKNVRFLDYIPNEDLRLLYSSADVFVYPCSSAGWGLPPIEAMACGLPVVTSNKQSLPEAVGDSAIKINPERAEEISKAIDSIVANPKLAKKLSIRGRKHVRRFSWESASRKTDATYRSLISESGALQ